MTLGYDTTTSLTSLPWCNSRGVNSIHHCHYTMASAEFDDFCLHVFNLNLNTSGSLGLIFVMHALASGGESNA